MIKAVVFDLDNTVYNYDLCHNKAMNKLMEYACEKYHLVEKDFFEKFDRAKAKVKKQLGNVGAAHNRMLYMQLFLESIGESPVKDALALYDIYWNCMLENMTLYEYVIPLMEQLKKNKIIIAVLTDLTAHIQHRKIHKLGLTEYIDVIVTSEEAGQEKPSIIAFNLLQRKVDCLPEEMLMIGDSQSKDIQGALNARMNAILFQPENDKTMDKICLESMRC